ncbi:unnamed protein product [Echinostoma caproni]|uniref:Vesicle transport protein USE1 n=1 Tax=Echinostoma caproni TaxID=27848 RepID=A0A183B048_9TREM|nr:unnamed protein product [Echinostoma caproni]
MYLCIFVFPDVLIVVYNVLHPSVLNHSHSSDNPPCPIPLLPCLLSWTGLKSGIQDSSDSDELPVDKHESTEQKRSKQSHLLQQEELRREELASEMLGMARELKDRSEAMSSRLQSDRAVVEASVSQADRNKAELVKAMHQLSEELGSRCACFVWIAFLIAVIVFVMMVFFMKMFRKRTVVYTTTYRSDL